MIKQTRSDADRPTLSRRSFLKAAAKSAAGLTLLGAGCAGYGFGIEPEWIALTDLPVHISRLTPAFHGSRIAHISDIHMDGEWMTRERLSRIVSLINAQEPDFVVITGDFVTHGTITSYLSDLGEVLSRLTPRFETLAILGNHDHWTDADSVRDMLDDCGMVNVSNGIYTHQIGDEALYLAGVDDYWERQDRLDLVLEALPEEGAAILLAHEPDYADISATTGRFDLQLSGHSHGGQVRIPFIGTPVLPPYAHKYPAGRYDVGEMVLYTNRGLGMIEPRVRFNCRPEITLVTLEASPA